MMEPFSYDDVLTTTTSTLTRNQVQSLNSVKQVCLVALDSLLRQIVRGCNRAERRHSESSFQDLTQRTLLHSIDEQTQRLAGVRGPLRRRDSSPALATISQVQEMLTYSPVVGNDTMDHDLACAVAALLEHVYRLLEDVQSPTKEDATAPMMERVHGDDLFAHLQGVLQQQVTHMTGTTDLWDELRQLIHTVGTLIGQRAANASAAVAQQGMDDATVEENKELGENDPLPAYDDIMDRSVGAKSESDEKANEKDEKDEKSEKPTDRPPSYRARTPERTQKDLDLLVSSIDRLSDLMPRLNNQRVDLSDRQADALAAATMGRTIDRLSRGRLDDQRASATDALAKYNHLPSLMAQLQRSASRTLDNQRASFDPKFQRQMNAAALSRLVAKNDRGRMANQVRKTLPEKKIEFFFAEIAKIDFSPPFFSYLFFSPPSGMVVAGAAND
ncbi:hypothetical protein BC940DRAFT_70717 [Gongronella butleri]|nr:hypothetical protein BC940DRAFT_70717 [Gongronella butleri]